MSQSASKKNAQYRRSLRKRQIEEYRHEIRQQMLKSQMQANQSRQLNQIILNLINTEDVLQIAHFIYRKDHLNLDRPLCNLNAENCLILFTFLCKQIHIPHSLLVLSNLIQCQYATIFLNTKNEQICVQFIRSIYKQCDEAVKVWVNSEEESEQKLQKQKTLNGYLAILKTLIYNKEQKNKQFLFLQIERHELIPKFFVKWFEYLKSHSLYMVMLILLQYELDISTKEPFKSFLISHPQIIVQLIEQADPKNNWNKALSLPSIAFANSCVRMIQFKPHITKFLISYFHATKIIYKYCQQNQQQFYKMATFMQTAETLSMLLKQIAAEPLQLNIGMLMCKQNFWTLTSVILRSQILFIRSIFHQIIKSAVQNIIVSGANLQEYIDYTFIGFITEGLDYNQQHIISCSLQSCQLILQYCQNKQSYNLIKIMDQYDLNGSLQNLKYSVSTVIANKSLQLIEAKDKLDKFIQEE